MRGRLKPDEDFIATSPEEPGESEYATEAGDLKAANMIVKPVEMDRDAAVFEEIGPAPAGPAKDELDHASARGGLIEPGEDTRFSSADDVEGIGGKKDARGGGDHRILGHGGQ